MLVLYIYLVSKKLLYNVIELCEKPNVQRSNTSEMSFLQVQSFRSISTFLKKAQEYLNFSISS